MQTIRHYEMPSPDDAEDGLDADQALLFGNATGYKRPRSSQRRLLAGGVVLALAMVTGAWIIVSLAELGWRLLP